MMGFFLNLGNKIAFCLQNGVLTPLQILPPRNFPQSDHSTLFKSHPDFFFPDPLETY